MCRLFAVVANTPQPVDRAFAALQQQSVEHKDGWGIAHYDGMPPSVEVGLEPAHASARFEELGRRLTTRRLLAHVRLASVGDVTQVNAHPFVWDSWVFMHNGTVARYAERRGELEAQAAPHWLARVRGETDSERCFALFMTQLELLGPVTVESTARALARVMALVADTCDRPGEKPSALNFLLSDGRRVFATRRHRTLVEASAPGVRIIASEPLWEDQPWQEVPPDGIVAIEEDLTVRRFAAAELRSSTAPLRSP